MEKIKINKNGRIGITIKTWKRFDPIVSDVKEVRMGKQNSFWELYFRDNDGIEGTIVLEAELLRSLVDLSLLNKGKEVQ